MPANPEITAALRAAADEITGAKMHRDQAAAAIAAFLRALPELSVCRRGACKYNGAFDAAALATAVEEASRDG